MLNKGNVLQYKANSSNLTQAQRYSKIAQGKWTNRNTTWATQNLRGYTNPNTTSLKRSGNVINVAIDPITGAIIGPTTAPITCPQFIIPVNEGLPSNAGGGTIEEPAIPPPVPPTPASETFPPIIPDTPVEPVVIQDEGILICSVQENVCTGETKDTLSQQLCNPTSDSDVPGTIQDLCWNDGTPTWYPRQRYIMTNSANKWPVNAGLSSSVRSLPPTITSITSNLNIVTLSWTQSKNCLPVLFFDIFQDGIIIQTVPGTIFTTDIVVDNCNTYNYFIAAVTNGSNITSEPSNTVSITISYLDSPTNLQYITIASGTIQLTWTPNCEAVSYNIYLYGSYIGNTSTTSFLVSGLTNCSTYTFSVTSLDIDANESIPITINNVIPLWPGPPTNLSASWVQENLSIITLNWNIPDPNCSEPVTYTLYWSIDNINFTSISILYGNTSYDFSPIIPDTTYYFYMESVNATGTSIPTATVSITTNLFTITGGSFVTTSTTSGSTITYNIVVNAGPSTLTFNVLPDLTYANFQLVGGGGGGGGCWAYLSQAFNLPVCGGGGGGGGGNLLINNCVVNNNPYTITVGVGGSGGQANDFSLGNNTNTAGGNGTSTSISSTNIICSALYGNGGEKSSGVGDRAEGGTGGVASITTLPVGAVIYSGNGGDGGRGNLDQDYVSGRDGTDGYFYTNSIALQTAFSPSTAYPTYLQPPYPPYPPYFGNPPSVTLTNWYSVSGGGGGGDGVSTGASAYTAGSGVGEGGSSGTEYDNDPPPYASFGGGGGGGGIISYGFPGGNGIAIIWFSYTF